MGKPGYIKPAPTHVTVVCSQCGARIRKREAIRFQRAWYCRACLCVDEYPADIYYAAAVVSKGNNSLRDMRGAM